MKKKLYQYLTENKIFNSLTTGFIDGAYNGCLNLEQRYSEPHRFYHTLDHVKHLISLIENGDGLTKKEKEILYIVAFFHDAIYNPRRKDNEERSADLLHTCCTTKRTQQDNLVRRCCNIIRDTKNHLTNDPLSKIFCEMDLYFLRHGSFQQLLENEKLIFKEYQFCSYDIYKKGRIEFLTNFTNHSLATEFNLRTIDSLIEYVNQFIPNVGLYAGSFNPVHTGHKDIVKKAEQIFDKVIIAAGTNPDKKDERVGDRIQSCFPFHETHSFNGMLTDFIKELNKFQKITLIRGLRNGYDFSYEINQLRFMEDMMGNTFPVVFIPCSREVDYISSSAIRSIDKIENTGFTSRYL